jgi:hypothetical protein
MRPLVYISLTEFFLLDDASLTDVSWTIRKHRSGTPRPRTQRPMHALIKGCDVQGMHRPRDELYQGRNISTLCSGMHHVIGRTGNEPNLTTEKKGGLLYLLFYVPLPVHLSARHPANGVEFWPAADQLGTKDPVRLLSEHSPFLQKKSGKPAVHGLFYWKGPLAGSVMYSAKPQSGFWPLTTPAAKGDLEGKTKEERRQTMKQISKEEEKTVHVVCNYLFRSLVQKER